MKKKLLAGFMSIAAVWSIALFSTPQALALETFDQRDQIRQITDLPETDPKIIVAKVISIALGFLGVICLLIILWSGFEWMTAGGNEEKTKNAKRRLTQAVIGLIIILSAFALSKFIIDSAVIATGA